MSFSDVAAPDLKMSGLAKDQALPGKARGSSASADWLRGLKRTAGITPKSNRTLASCIDAFAGVDAQQPALVAKDKGLSYGELSYLSNQVARWALTRGLGKGDCVGLLMGNCPEYAAIWIGLSRLGIITALFNTKIRGDGLRHCVEVADPNYLIADSDGLTNLVACGVLDRFEGSHFDGLVDAHDGAPLQDAEVQPVQLSDIALLIFTSGTTGLPKAARVSHFRIMMWSEWFAGISNTQSTDRLYNCLPMYHSIGGVVAIGSMLVCGGSVILREGFSASRFWDDVSSSGATMFQYIGELCRYLVTSPASENERCHTLRLCCGNGLREDVWRDFQDRFAIPRIIEFYASTEGSFSLFNLDGKPGAIGRFPPLIGQRSPVALVRFDFDTELPVRGPDGRCIRCEPGEAGEALGRITADAADLATRFEGYTSAAATQAKVLRDVFEEGDTWFRTGDLMKQDRQGFYYFVDRIGETFRWKGENVSTSEVADTLCRCAGVLEAIVYGVPVPGAEGRVGMAALVTTPDFDLAKFRAHVAENLAAYARPAFLRIGGSLDATGTFKVRKVDYQREAYDPAVIPDALFVDDARTGSYRTLTPDIHADIGSGRLRI